MQRLYLWIGCAIAVAACSNSHRSAPVSTGMGIDAFGHTHICVSRSTVAPDRKAHLDRLIARLRVDLPKYRSVERAYADGYRREGPDVPVGQLKHFLNYANLQANHDHLDPDRPVALLYRRTARGYELAGVMFAAPIEATMDELDKRIPLAYGHWHSHRNICQPAKTTHVPATQASEFGFSGSINTPAKCEAAGGVFMDNVFGWMVHVYPFERDVAKQF